ncbi:hypothetical protein PPA191_gp05 [Liberibacter phage P-PA19-1]|nr:hypothetical protein PPA191_gp05 [Liberibacter phage P-PA19-1]
MKPECIQVLNKAAGRELSKKELRWLEEGIVRAYASLGGKGLSKAERYRLAGLKAEEDFQKELIRSVNDAIDEAYKRHRLRSDLDRVQAGLHGQSQALFNKLFFKAGSAEVPLEMKIKAAETKVLSKFNEYAEVGSKNLGFTLDKQFGLDVFDEMKGKKTQNEQASRLVKQYFETQRELHSQAREAGLDYKFFENRIPQPMSVDKLRATKKEDFVRSMLDWLDFSRYKDIDGTPLSRSEIASFVGEVFAERVRSTSFKDPSIPSSEVGVKREFERVFHFKDSQSHMDYMEHFGVSTNVNTILTSELASLSKDIVIARELGPNADSFVKQTIAQAIANDQEASAGNKALKDWLGRNKLEVRQEAMLQMWDVMRHGETVENAGWANWMAGLRSAAAASMLGQHPIGALLEDGFISRQMLSRIGIDKEAIQRINTMPLRERMELLSDVGLYAEGVVAHGRNMMEGSDAFQIGHKLHSKMHKWSGSEYLDKRRISSHALIVYNQIGRMVDTYASLKDLKADPRLDPSVKAFFKQLDDTDYAVIKRAKARSSPDGDLSARTPSTIKTLKDADLRDLVRESEETAYHRKKLKNSKTLSPEQRQELQQQLADLERKEINVLKDKVSNKMHALVLDNVQTSVRGAMHTSLFDRQRLGLLTYKRGTRAGEALRMFQQFTTTPTGMLLNTIDLYNSAKMPKGASMELSNVWTKYIATMALAGIGAASIKALLRGEDPSLPEVIYEGTLANGALLPYVDRLTKLVSKGDRAKIGGLFGPVPSMVTNLTSSAVELAPKDNENPKVKATKAIRKTLPFMNMWYLKNSFDHLILNQILEELNPGYLDRQQSRKKKNGIELFQNMDEGLPHRLPFPFGED